MKGLTLARRYWEEVGRPAFEEACPALLSRGAIGLVGEGSECFGYDDEISRDHDWGPGFCLWLTREDMERYGERAKEVYAALPLEFLGFRRLRQTEQTTGRVGVQEVGGFYRRFIGLDRPPQTLDEWRMIPEHGLAVCTNGAVFTDPAGAFTGIREGILAYYPEDVRRKKLAARCALAAQSGQYNYARCLKRGETAAAFMALSQFIDHAQGIVFLLNRRYRPYYKWADRAMGELPALGKQVSALTRDMVCAPLDSEEKIEKIAALLIAELRRQGFSDAGSDFLLHHAQRVQGGIRDEKLRAEHLMAG